MPSGMGAYGRLTCRHEFVEEDDPAEPRRVRRCAKCGLVEPA